MYVNGIDFPNGIIDAINNKKFVVFVGAGASMGEPTNLPSFNELADLIANGTGKVRSQKETCDAFLGRLKVSEIDVNKRTVEILNKKSLKPNKLHENIINLFPNIEDLKIVTTNYDRMFETVLEERGATVKVYDAPALPLGNDVKGIIHIHGSVLEPEYMVVTDEDFGKAYLCDGYVSRFLVKLFESYTVLFIGYSYDDVIARYLTRALTKNNEHKRYILIDRDEGGWSGLGIELLQYEHDNHENMSEALNQFGIRIRRGLLDWETSLRLIADRPPVDLAIESEVDYCLQDESRARVLMNCVHGKEWVLYLERKSVFECLFSDKNVLSKIELEWANWLAQELLENDCDIIFDLICEHNNILNKGFVGIIANQILNTTVEYTDNAIRKTVLLVYTLIDDPWLILRLHELVLARNMIPLAWSLFKRFFEYTLVLEKSFYYLPSSSTDVKHKFLAQAYIVEKAWEDSKEKYLESSAMQILEFGKTCVLDIHFAYVSAGMATKESEPFDFAGVHVEKEGKIFGDDDPLHLLSNIINDACEKVSNQDPKYAREYIQQCVFSESALLRKMGLSLLRETSVFTADEKIDCLFKNYKLDEYHEKEQIFKLVAKVFDDLSESVQNELLRRIGDIYVDDEFSNAYKKYNWYIWLQKSCKDNSKINKLISNIKENYPEFSPREHPELNFYSSSAEWDGDTSPVTKDEILCLNNDDIVELLDSYEGDKWDGPNRYGLLSLFSNVVKENYEWSEKVLHLMLEKLIDKDDVWHCYFTGISQSKFTLKQYINILSLIQDEKIVCKYADDLSDILRKCIELDETKERFKTHKKTLHEISIRIWKSRSVSVKLGESRLIDKCLNCATGTLVFCWVKMLSYENGKTIMKPYKMLFEEALSIESIDREQSICILAGQFAFLFSKDKKWCRTNIFPLLKSVDEKEFTASWEGVAYFSRCLYKELADEMMEIYLFAVEHLSKLQGEVRKAFIEIYTLLLIYVIENPIDVHIPRFLNVADEDDKSHFASTINKQLKNMQEQQKKEVWNNWLKEYWINRTKNIPVLLTEKESSEMLFWILNLGSLYPEGVGILLRCNKISISGNWFLHYLKEGDWSIRYPEETLNLLIHLLEIDAEENYHIREIKSVVLEIQKHSDVDIDRVKEIFLKKNYQF